jgi:S-adenosylmethionine synthetase
MTKLSHLSLCPSAYSDQDVEIVERKGIGHPDTICDALAEELSRNLCKFYLDNFGLVLHHNVDKALLWGGVSRPAFNGGEVVSPIEIFLAGRATCEYKDIRVPLDDIVEQSCSNWLNSNFHVLDVAKHIKLHSLIRPGSSDLVELYLRQESTGIALANDTSCGVGYAPLSETERLVMQLEQTLNSVETKTAYPETGEDIKVMAVRHGEEIELTVSCAFIDRYIKHVDDYLAKKMQLAELVVTTASTISAANISVIVNAADDVASESLYMTVTGTSAEAGDDGEVGRGNRVNGLITPYRPMNMEAAAGKNPVTHVGKLYNIVAQQIAQALVDKLEEVSEASCYLVSRIGSPVNQPAIVDVRVSLTGDGRLDTLQIPVDEIVSDKLENIDQIRHLLVNGVMSVY